MEKVLLTDPGYGEVRLTKARAKGQYEALASALSKDPDFVMEAIAESGLRGRGAGWPVHDKWMTVRRGETETKYVICNADEGEPGSFKDRALLERFPHKVLEGMLLAGRASGAASGIFYVKEEHEEAADAFEAAMAEAREANLLGENILGSGWDFDVKMAKFPSTKYPNFVYVCGEETALLEFLEGRRPLPRRKPPYPAESGLYGKPTLIHNVETFAQVPAIVRNGGAWFRSRGVEDLPGTLLMSVMGPVNNPDVFEVEAGTSLRVLIEELAGGILEDRGLKAIAPGGPSSPFLRGDDLDHPLTYKGMEAAGTLLGMGAVWTIANGTCMVEEVLKIARYFERMTCRQCAGCGMGTSVIYSNLTDIRRGVVGPEYLDYVLKVAEWMPGPPPNGICDFVVRAPLAVSSAIRLFPEDFEQHIREGRCADGTYSLVNRKFYDPAAAAGSGDQDMPIRP